MQTGYVPQGLVMGTCVYHIAHRGLGQTLGSAGQNVELPNFTQALYEARELAMTRMQDEANQLEASGIVGVRLEEKSHQWGSHTIEFLSLGTAVAQDLGRSHLREAHHHHLARQLMAGVASDLPEAAGRRFAEGAFTSALTVPDFAACLQMGLEPVGFVQGFCVMQWQWYGIGSPYGTFGLPRSQGGVSGYSETWQCPHGFVSAEHRSWGQNYEQSWIEDAWRQGFGSAYDRMIEEASAAGAHGVVGVVDASERLGDMGVLEFRVQGTAVKVRTDRLPADGRPWTTYLAGQRLAKSIEAGFAPVAIAASVASVRVWAYCITEYLSEGSSAGWGVPGDGGEIDQTSRASMAVRRIARATGAVPARRRFAPRGLDGHHRARARPRRRRAPVHPAGKPGTPVQGIRPDAEPSSHGADAVSPRRRPDRTRILSISQRRCATRLRSWAGPHAAGLDRPVTAEDVGSLDRRGARPALDRVGADPAGLRRIDPSRFRWACGTGVRGRSPTPRTPMQRPSPKPLNGPDGSARPWVGAASSESMSRSGSIRITST